MCPYRSLPYRDTLIDRLRVGCVLYRLLSYRDTLIDRLRVGCVLYRLLSYRDTLIGRLRVGCVLYRLLSYRGTLIDRRRVGYMSSTGYCPTETHLLIGVEWDVSCTGPIEAHLLIDLGGVQWDVTGFSLGDACWSCPPPHFSTLGGSGFWVGVVGWGLRGAIPPTQLFILTGRLCLYPPPPPSQLSVGTVCSRDINIFALPPPRENRSPAAH